MSDWVIEAEGLCKRYATGGGWVRALQDVSLSVRRGEFVVLHGRSGSGKTTLLNLLGALDRPDAGKLVVAGVDLMQAEAERLAWFRLHRVGFVFQAYNLIRTLTALENAAFVLELRGVAKDQREQKAKSLLQRMGIAELADRRADALSGGQQQRVAVARALAGDPVLVLADEPTANLDRDNARSLIRLMRELCEERGTTFVIASHDPEVVAAAPRRIQLDDGRIVAEQRDE